MTNQHQNRSRLLFPRQIASFLISPDDRPKGVVRCSPPGSSYSPIRELLETGTDGAVGRGEVEAALSELQGTQEIDHCGADFVRSFLLRPVAAALEHDGTAQLRYEAQ